MQDTKLSVEEKYKGKVEKQKKARNAGVCKWVSAAIAVARRQSKNRSDLSYEVASLGDIG